MRGDLSAGAKPLGGVLISEAPGWNAVLEQLTTLAPPSWMRRLRGREGVPG